jgi:hypothetical protein
MYFKTPGQEYKSKYKHDQNVQDHIKPSILSPYIGRYVTGQPCRYENVGMAPYLAHLILD